MSRDFTVKDETTIMPSVIEIDLFHYAVHAKLAFTMDVEGDIDSGGISIGFRTGSAAKYIHLLYKAYATAEAHFDLYIGGNMTIAGGTDIAPINRNQIPPLTDSTMEGFATASWVANRVTLNPTVTPGTATQLRHFHFGEGRKIGGGENAAWEFVLPAATICALIVTDEAGATNLANLIATWFEVPPAA